MAKRTCSRATGPKAEKAEHRITFCWGGGRFALDLCTPHEGAYNVDLHIWARHGRRVGGHDAFRDDQPPPVDEHAHCDRCILPHPATQRLRTCISGQRYELALCDRHAEAFDLDILPWIRVAQLVDGGHEPNPVDAAAPGPLLLHQRDRATDEITRLLKLINERNAAALRAADTQRTAPTPSLFTEPLPVRPPEPFAWHITFHAGLRALQRDISYDDLVDAVQKPEVVTASKHTPGIQLHHRGGIYAVVDPQAMRVITICRRDEDADAAIDAAHTGERTNA